MSLTIGRYHFPRGLPDTIPDHDYVMNNERTTVRYTGSLGRLQQRGLVPLETIEVWVQKVAACYPDWVEMLPAPPMTREEAITAVRDAWFDADTPHGATTDDYWAELRTVLAALGVTESEMNQAHLPATTEGES